MNNLQVSDTSSEPENLPQDVQILMDEVFQENNISGDTLHTLLDSCIDSDTATKPVDIENLPMVFLNDECVLEDKTDTTPNHANQIINDTSNLQTKKHLDIENLPMVFINDECVLEDKTDTTPNHANQIINDTSNLQTKKHLDIENLPMVFINDECVLEDKTDTTPNHANQIINDTSNLQTKKHLDIENLPMVIINDECVLEDKTDTTPNHANQIINDTTNLQTKKHLDIENLPIVFVSDGCVLEGKTGPGPSCENPIIDSIIVTDNPEENKENTVSNIESENFETEGEQFQEQKQENKGNLEIQEFLGEKVKKRNRNPSEWKQNKRKAKRETGKPYVDRKGKEHPARKISGNCRPSCTYQCKNITTEERQIIFEQFWKLSDVEKGHFYARFVQRNNVARRRVKSGNDAKKNWSFRYTFEINGEKYIVCKEFFLGTLNISSKRIYYFFKTTQNPLTNIPRTPKKGNKGARAIPTHDKDLVRNHIKSFPCIDSHYCRANTTKKFLDSSLNLSRMYDLYVEWLPKEFSPVKKSMYCYIFNSEFNLAFHQLKKDLCDKCEEFKKIVEPSDEIRNQHEIHLKNKVIGRSERQRDRENKEQDVGVITFDLENVFALPKINVSTAFYKKKLNCYNLTGHCNINGVTYCSIWDEHMSGRAANHLASALIKILTNVIKDNNNLRKIILWSDSCVPQNKNSIMSMALQTFLQSADSHNLLEIEQKFSEPGHGNLQEIDAVHSVIERFLRPKEIMSPVTLIKLLTHMPSTFKTKLRVLQMNINDFRDYQKIALLYVYNVVPYTKVKHIIYKKLNPFVITFRNSFEDELKEVDICQYRANKALTADITLRFPKVGPLSSVSAGLRKDKKEHISSMLKYMEGVDLLYFKHILKCTDKRIEDQTKDPSTSHNPSPKVKISGQNQEDLMNMDQMIKPSTSKTSSPEAPKTKLKRAPRKKANESIYSEPTMRLRQRKVEKTTNS